MPRTAIPLIVGSDAGASDLGAGPDAAGGIVPPNSVLIVHNASAASINVTAQTPSGSAGAPSGLDLPDRVLAVAAGAMAAMGPFPPAWYARSPGSADAGHVYIDFSAVANVTAFAVQVAG